MPSVYNSFAVNLTTNAATTVYTSPANTATIINFITLSNVDASNADTVEICVRKSGAGADVFLNKGLSINVGTTLTIPGPINLAAGDILKIKATTANRIDAYGSFLQIT
jgi:hypothetical protein